MHICCTKNCRLSTQFQSNQSIYKGIKQLILNRNTFHPKCHFIAECQPSPNVIRVRFATNKKRGKLNEKYKLIDFSCFKLSLIHFNMKWFRTQNYKRRLNSCIQFQQQRVAREVLWVKLVTLVVLANKIKRIRQMDSGQN